jgi:hypothetical protein
VFLISNIESFIHFTLARFSVRPACEITFDEFILLILTVFELAIKLNTELINHVYCPNFNNYFLEGGGGLEGLDGLGGLFPLPGPDGFPVVLGALGGL